MMAVKVAKPLVEVLVDEAPQVPRRGEEVRLSSQGVFKEVALNEIRPGRFQPRQEFGAAALFSLAESIRDEGLLNPVIVVLRDDGNYELLAGERRWRASCALAIAPLGMLAQAIDLVATATWPEMLARGDWQQHVLATATILVRQQHVLATTTILVSEQPAGLGDLAQQTIALVDNLQRADLNPIEEARALHKFKGDLGLSLRDLAAKIGKSKSYVEDRLKLLDLSDEVMQMVADPDTDFDLSLAREIARKISSPLQMPLAERLRKLAGKVETNKIIKSIGDIARFIEPNRWSLSHDLDIPHAPRYANRARLIRLLLATTAPDTLAAALVKLSGVDSHTNYLSGNVDKFLSSGWEFNHVANVLHLGKDDSSSQTNLAWNKVAPGQGWTCETCALRQLHGAIERDARVHSFDFQPQCLKLDRWSDPDQISTCPGYVGPDDPQIIEMPSEIVDYLDGDSGGMLHQPLQGAAYDNRYYVTSWTDYQHLYIVAGQKLARAQGEKAEADKLAYLAPMRAYWESQNAELYGEVAVFDVNCFQAHACRRCVNFLADSDRAQSGQPGYPPCRLAYSPLVAKGNPRPPDYGVWVSEEGKAVPRCERFQVREMPAVQRALGGSFTIGDRELILSWYNQLVRQLSVGMGEQLKIYRPLRWLTGPRPDLAEVWAEIGDDDIMMALLNIGVVEAANAYNDLYSRDVETIDADGSRTAWKVLSWDDYEKRRKPYKWDDRQLPWAQGSGGAGEQGSGGE